MSKYRTIGQFVTPHVQNYYVVDEQSETVAGPFVHRLNASKEEHRLNAQAEAEAQRSGARPVDPIACATELVHLWVDESIAARVRYYAGHQPSLDRLTDCEHAARKIACAIASERNVSTTEGIPGRIAADATIALRFATEDPKDAKKALHAALLSLLAKDTADRLSGALAMDNPLPVLP